MHATEFQLELSSPILLDTADDTYLFLLLHSTFTDSVGALHANNRNMRCIWNSSYKSSTVWQAVQTQPKQRKQQNLLPHFFSRWFETHDHCYFRRTRTLKSEMCNTIVRRHWKERFQESSHSSVAICATWIRRPDENKKLFAMATARKRPPNRGTKHLRQARGNLNIYIRSQSLQNLNEVMMVFLNFLLCAR